MCRGRCGIVDCKLVHLEGKIIAILFYFVPNLHTHALMKTLYDNLYDYTPSLCCYKKTHQIIDCQGPLTLLLCGSKLMIQCLFLLTPEVYFVDLRI